MCLLDKGTLETSGPFFLQTPLSLQKSLQPSLPSSSTSDRLKFHPVLLQQGTGSYFLTADEEPTSKK